MRTILLMLCLLGLPALAQQSVREKEIQECRPGEARTWGDGRDQRAIAAALEFRVDARGAPPGFTPEQLLQAVRLAASSWGRCGVPASVTLSGAPDAPGLVRVQWSDAGAQGHFGLANITRRTLSLGPAAFRLLAQRHPNAPAAQILQMTISHEMGHFFGLMAHSRRCVDVMSYYNDGKGGQCSLREGRMQRGVDYRAVLPTACDIERCRRLNAN